MTLLGFIKTLTAVIKYLSPFVSVCQQSEKGAVFLLYWPESRSSHTGRRGRCPGGSEVVLGFLHFGPASLHFWTRLAVEPAQMPGGSAMPLSKSEGPTRLQTACSLPQWQMGGGLREGCPTKLNATVWIDWPSLVQVLSSLMTRVPVSSESHLTLPPDTPSAPPSAFSYGVYCTGTQLLLGYLGTLTMPWELGMVGHRTVSSLWDLSHGAHKTKRVLGISR